MRETQGGPLRKAPLEGSGRKETKAAFTRDQATSLEDGAQPSRVCSLNHEPENPCKLKAVRGNHSCERGCLGLQIPSEAFRIRESELKDGDMSISCPILIFELLTLPCLSLSI